MVQGKLPFPTWIQFNSDLKKKLWTHFYRLIHCSAQCCSVRQVAPIAVKFYSVYLKFIVLHIYAFSWVYNIGLMERDRSCAYNGDGGMKFARFIFMLYRSGINPHTV